MKIITNNNKTALIRFLLSCLSVILITLLFPGCRLILGLKQPVLKDAVVLNEYLYKKGFDTTYSFTFNKASFDSLNETPYKPGWEKGFRPLQFMVFDSGGRLIAQYSSCEGSLKKRKILETYPPLNISGLDSSVTFSNDIGMYRDFRANKLKITCSDENLTFIVYWATWLGKPCLNIMRAVKKYVEQNPERKIKVIYVNVAEIYK